VIRPGEPWGSPASSPPDLAVDGDDAALAAAVAAAPGALVAFRPGPGSDLARAVGLRAGSDAAAATTELPVDAVRLTGEGLACNAVVLGAPPDRLRWASAARTVELDVDGQPWFAGSGTTVVIANGQFLRGADVVPRGHPGDGRLEVQVYELHRRERRAMRRRLATGAHVPHPRIRSRTARRIDIRAPHERALEVDGVRGEPRRTLSAEVVPAAFRLLV
jgi:putative lipid kinase YegS-like protein